MTPRTPAAALLAGSALSTLAPRPAPAWADANTQSIVVEASEGHHTADGVTGLQPGGGLIKKATAPESRSTVSNDYIQKQAPAQSPFMLAQLLPGAVVSEVDPWGLSGGALNLRPRSAEMAFICEGSPIADIGVCATYPSEFADSENLEDLSLQQGSSNIDTPTINGSGGLFTFHDRDSATVSAAWLITATAPTNTTASSPAWIAD